VLRGHTLTVRCLEVLDGKQIAVSGSRDSILRVWNVETYTMLHLFVSHHHRLRSIDVAGNHMASGTTARVASGKLKRISAPTHAVRTLLHLRGLV
jgi:WD40 repeat protein